MSSLEHTQKSGKEENEPMNYEVEYQKLKEEIALLKQSLEREQKLNAHNSPLFVIGMCSDVKKRLIGWLVSRLPDLVLKALFRQMTLEDQIEARKVCRRWADLVPEATIKRRELILLLGVGFIAEFEKNIDWTLFYNRQSLQLLLNPDGTAMYPIQRLTSWNSLHLDWLDQATAEEIANTFTKTKELQVIVLKDLSSMANNLAHLLEQWPHQLVTFQLFEGHNYYEPQRDRTRSQPYVRLFAAINAQSALKKLHLILYSKSMPDLSIVSQLEELRFNLDGTTAKEFVQMLQQYGEGNQGLAQIVYETSYLDALDQFTRLSEQLRLCFTRLDFFPDSIPKLALICAQFSGLTSLTLNPFHITPRHLFTHLATLRQLIHLHLTFYSNSFPSDDLEHLLLPQVKSVKALDLVLWFKIPAHRELAEMKISWTLPAVEVIRFELDYFSCTECHINNFRQPSEQAKSCLRQLFAPLKRGCARLRLIEHNQEEALGTAEELLAE